MTAKVISIGIQKGGVGKSTSCAQMGFFLVEKGFKTLLIDMDSQGNSSGRITQKKRRKDTEDEFTRSFQLLSENNSEKIQVEETKYGLDVIRANSKDSGLLEVQHSSFENAYIFGKNLEKYGLLEQYDYIVIDCPPSVDFRMVAPLIASNYLLMPLELAAYSESGVEDMFEDALLIKENLNPNLEILGFFANKVNRVSKDHKQGMKEFRTVLGDQLFFKNVIGGRIALDYATGRGLPISQVKSSAGRDAKREVHAVFEEMLKRIKKIEKKKKAEQK
mgnify:CR=1 FL=1